MEVVPCSTRKLNSTHSVAANAPPHAASTSTTAATPTCSPLQGITAGTNNSNSPASTRQTPVTQGQPKASQVHYFGNVEATPPSPVSLSISAPDASTPPTSPTQASTPTH